MTSVLGRALQSMLYGVRAGDAMSMMATAALLIAVVFLAAWVPAFRASREDSAHVLRGG
jgi:ABC-type lipoprotein release transport system permease subunit